MKCASTKKLLFKVLSQTKYEICMEIRLRIWKDLSSSEKDLCRGREEQDEFKSAVLEQVCNCFDSQTENMERFEL